MNMRICRSFPSPTINADLCRTQTGKRPFITDYPEACTACMKVLVSTWHSLVAFLRKSGWIALSPSLAKQVMKLKVAAKVYAQERDYYEREIVPLLGESRSWVEFIGEVGGQEKDEFLGNAYALLFPIDWPEPFGLVMIEAMACGTPVIAWRIGSVPEIVEEGVTGFVVGSIDEAVQAVGRISELSRAICRHRFEERYDASRMVDNYLKVYRSLVA